MHLLYPPAEGTINECLKCWYPLGQTRKYRSEERLLIFQTLNTYRIRGCIQKFPDWPPGERTANGTALCHYMQLYSYFVS